MEKGDLVVPAWLLAFVFFALVVALGSAIDCRLQKDNYRANAMDLCAWHARRSCGDVSSEEATKLWHDIVNGRAVCPFCGQKHDDNWISRNAWESQVNAKEKEIAK